MNVDCFELVKAIRPFLYHLPQLRQVLGMVIGSTDIVPFTMRQLSLNHIRAVSLFIEQGCGHAPETVYCHLIFAISHAPDSIQQPHVCDTASFRKRRRKDKAAVSMFPQCGKEPDHLPSQRDNMRLLHLHAPGWDNPFSRIQINLFPCRTSQLLGADKDIGGYRKA